ncbi:hypothetical protein C8R46DRAFT_1341954 [Mycena filopes]|nr:hypothetical protein C8R46DRAFT_1341954 [Mycena filopes]
MAPRVLGALRRTSYAQPHPYLGEAPQKPFACIRTFTTTPQSDGHVPELTPNFVAHCFDALQLTPQYNHPLIGATSIKTDIRAVSFQLHRLPPQSRVLALCIICCASLTSFHPAVLGDGPRPQSFADVGFFASCPDLRVFGLRRAPAYHGLRTAALKAAWEVGIILQPSNENAASCFLLDLLEQSDFNAASRPWANAYMSHVRALAPIWRANDAPVIAPTARWVGHLMGDALISARSRTPITPNDQLLLCGPQARSLQSFIALLGKPEQASNLALLWATLGSYASRVIDLSRQLSDTITGDYARTNPLSEGATSNFVTALVQLHAALTQMLAHVDATVATAPPPHEASVVLSDDIPRTCAYGATFGFIALLLPFYRELAYRGGVSGSHEMRRLRAQTHGLAVLGVRELARCIRCYLPRVHYTPVHWRTVLSWAEFCAEEVEAGSAVGLSPEGARDVETIVKELKLLGYSLEAASAPHPVALVQLLEGHLNRAIVDMFLPPMDNGGWLAGPGPFDVQTAR